MRAVTNNKRARVSIHLNLFQQRVNKLGQDALVTLAFALSMSAVCSAFAQSFPLKDKAVTIVVPFTAGGPTDRLARDMA